MGIMYQISIKVNKNKALENGNFSADCYKYIFDRKSAKNTKKLLTKVKIFDIIGT